MIVGFKLQSEFVVEDPKIPVAALVGPAAPSIAEAFQEIARLLVALGGSSGNWLQLDAH